MEDIIQTLPNNEYMLKHDLTLKEALRFYKNTWSRYLASRLIDVEADRQRVAIDPNMKVIHGDKDQMGRYFEQEMPVKYRIEERKKLVENALETLRAIDALIQTPNEEFEAKHLSEEALKVSAEVEKELTGEAPTETKPADNPADRGAVDEGQTPAATEEPVREGAVVETPTQPSVETPAQE